MHCQLPGPPKKDAKSKKKTKRINLHPLSYLRGSAQNDDISRVQLKGMALVKVVDNLLI